MKKKLYILDVSGFIFRAYFALPPMTNAHGESTNGLYGFIRSVMKLFKEFDPDHIVAVFDGPDNKKTRTDIYEKYKANRTRENADLPEQIERAKEFCELIGIPYMELPGVEADDTMGTIAKWATKKGAISYLCTADKDLCQLVDSSVYILNPWKDNLVIDSDKVEEIYGVPPNQIIDLLAIMGDSSDNIPGLSGFGPKTAVPLLQQFGSLEALLKNPELVKGAKKQETLREEADIARLSQRLATIHTDLDFPEDKTLFSLLKTDTPKLRAFYLEMGFSTLVRELDAFSQPPKEEQAASYTLVNSEEAFEKLLKKLKNEKEWSFDLETTHIRPILADPVGIGFCAKAGEAYYVPFNGNLDPKRITAALKPILEDSSIGFYAHNAKYDLHVLENIGIRVANLCFDTILASFLLNSASRRHSLDHLALQLFGKVKTPIKELIGSGKKEITMDQVDIKRVSDYCCEDVDYTLRLKKHLEKELKERKLETLLFDLELPVTRVLLRMERHGMHLDVKQLYTFAKELKNEIDSLAKEIFVFADEAFNINSPKQLSRILFEKMGITPLKKTTTGYSTKADVLEELAKEHPIAAKIIEYRTLEKLRSTYAETLPLEVNPKTGRVHPTFNQFVAATGRLACQDPNLQNIPVRTQQGRRIRKAFRPQKPGWSYLSADYSQIELRLLAHLSDDPHLIKAFKQGEDIHTFTASLMFEIPLNQVSKLQRHQAKAINFGILYGQQAYGLSQELGIEMDKAAAFITAYFERYPKVLAYLDTSVKKARETGKSFTMIGRERELPEITSKNVPLRNAAERLATNTPLQGSAADLIKEAMLDIDRILSENGYQSYMVLQIHDELIFESPDNELETLSKCVKEVMEGVYKLKVPLIVDLSIGKNWGEC